MTIVGCKDRHDNFRMQRACGIVLNLSYHVQDQYILPGTPFFELQSLSLSCLEQALEGQLSLLPVKSPFPPTPFPIRDQRFLRARI